MKRIVAIAGFEFFNPRPYRQLAEIVRCERLKVT
jgi:hypothetical protein